MQRWQRLVLTVVLVMMGDLWTIEAEFAGRGNGWTDISADVMLDDITTRSGLMGTGPNDLVAGAGTFSFVLDNGDTNSAGLLGYYSPHHANKRSGFRLGIRVRLSVQVPTYPLRYKFVGSVDSILPLAGIDDRQVTLLTVTDWLDYASLTKVSALGIELEKRSDELFTILVESLAIQPSAIQVGTGKDIYPFAFDNVQDESRTVLSELNRLAQSERGRIYIKGDTVQGGTLTFEPRGARITNQTNVDVFTDADLRGLDAPHQRSHIVNRAQAITSQRRLGATATEVLYNSESRVKVRAGTVLELFAPYRDPLAEAERISAVDVDGTPAAGTDYTATANEDGTGDTLTAFVNVQYGDGGNGAYVDLANSAAVDAWVWFRVLGRGLYTYRTTVAEHEDADSVTVNGRRTVTMDMPYQSSVAVATEVARYTVRLWTDPGALPVVEFQLTEDDPDFLDRVLRREIGDRVGLEEEVTGLDETTASPVVRGYFINAIDLSVVGGVQVIVRWTMQPADETAYWRLGVVGLSEVGTALVAPGQIIGHADQPHGDSAHVDIAHGDSAHVDTAHADSGHVDHTDGAGAHDDVAHADDAHGDTPHVDETTSHEDVAHEDTAHVDTVHQDTAHGDTAHEDVAHDDDEHGDHDDVGHQDHDDLDHGDHDDGANPDPHDDTTHDDDAHEDTAHVDSEHVDVAHGDDAHEDTPHEDEPADHDDGAHVDDPHDDTAHLDHTDATHQDIAHGDTAHVDTAHSDSAHQDTAHLDAEHVDEG